MKQRHSKKPEQTVNAKELAEMAFCEKRVLLAHLHGKRLTLDQQQGAERGRRAHERYYREGVAAASTTGSDRRCFIATHLFGEHAWQTTVLRVYRDDVLLRHPSGRLFVDAYYAVGPRMCRLLARQPWLRPPVRALVEMFARVARLQTGGRGS